MSSLGKTIKVLRVASGFKQSDFATAVAISQNYLSLIESDRKEPSLEVVQRIADQLGLSAEALFFLSMPLPDGLTSEEIDLFDRLKRLVGRLAGPEAVFAFDR